MKHKTKKLLILSALLPFLLSVMFPTAVSALDNPDISHSKASLVYCTEPDVVLWSENPDMEVYPAALTKLMTAVLAAESIINGKIGSDDYLTASSAAIKATEGNNISIKTGESIRLRDLIGAMVLSGANDAALVIAEGISGSVSDFVSLMNAKAAELGMEHTVYTNPTGLHDDRMVTTASDLLLLAQYASGIQFLSELCGSIRITIDATNKSDVRYLGTRNYLLSTRVSSDYYLSTANGMICGSTNEAGFCIIATAQHDGLNYIAIVLGADTTTVVKNPGTTGTDKNGNTVVITPPEYKYIMNGFIEAAELLTWADKNFEYIKAVDSSTPVCQIPVKLAEDVDSVTLLPETPIELYVPVDIDRDKDIKLSWVLDTQSLTAPVKAGQRVGTLTVTYKGETIGQVPLIVKSNIVQSGGLTFLNRIEQLASTPFFKVILIAIAAGALIYVFATAISRSRKKAAAKREFIKKNRYLGNGK